MTPDTRAGSNELVKALVELASAMRDEGLARRVYVGNAFEAEAAGKINTREQARLNFEAELKSYVERLVKA